MLIALGDGAILYGLAYVAFGLAALAVALAVAFVVLTNGSSILSWVTWAWSAVKGLFGK